MANPLLQHYIKLTEFLGQALGPDYEVALHDMTDKNRSIVAIANNHISGREIGAPLTNVALKILMDKSYETQDYRLHYCGLSAEGKTLRSSTMFIKHNGKLVGMLCINFDDSRYLAASENVLRLCHPDIFIDDHIAPQQAEPGDPFPRAVPATTESFHNSIDAVAGDAVGRELIRLGVTADRSRPMNGCRSSPRSKAAAFSCSRARSRMWPTRCTARRPVCTAIFPRLKRTTAIPLRNNIFTMQMTKTAESERKCSRFCVSLFIC